MSAMPPRGWPDPLLRPTDTAEVANNRVGPSLDSEAGNCQSTPTRCEAVNSVQDDAVASAVETESSRLGSKISQALLTWAAEGRLGCGHRRHDTIENPPRLRSFTRTCSNLGFRYRWAKTGLDVFNGEHIGRCNLGDDGAAQSNRHSPFVQWCRVCKVVFLGAAAALTLLLTLQNGLGWCPPLFEFQGGPVSLVLSPARFDSRLIRDGTPETRSSTASGELTPSSGFPSKAIPPMSRALTATGTKDAALQVGKIEPDRRTDQAVTAVTPSSRRARVGYLIMTSGMDELQKTKRLLKAIHQPSNFYLIHLDRKSGDDVRIELEEFIRDWSNVRILIPALDVSWGGYTVTLTAIFGICTMVQWSDEWDFFVNLSASDFPLLPQDELTEVLGRYADTGMNFVEGAPLNERNRVEVLIDDQGLYREVQSSKAGRPLKIGKPRQPPSKSMFTVYKGEFWVILHRSFCRYIEASPDNVARSLQVHKMHDEVHHLKKKLTRYKDEIVPVNAYFSRFRISDESYFQTVLCHPQAPSFPVYADNLRFVSWPEVGEGYYVLHPDPITGANVGQALDSGALFARKFDYKESRQAYAVLEEHLAVPSEERLARSVQRLEAASRVVGRKTFCAIPEGYSIQEVLSRPPKSAMERQKARTKTSNGKTQTREAMEGKKASGP